MIERTVQLPSRGELRVLESEGPANAPVVFLLHGLAATARLNWGPSFEALGTSFRVVAPDHRGHGRGLPTRGVFKLEQCADDVAALATAMGIERFLVVGYSMGGAIAQLTWKRHPDRVSGLVLCATAARFASSRQRQTATFLQPMLSLAARTAPQSLWKRQGERLLANIPDPERRARIAREIEGTRPGAVVDAAAALARFDSRLWLGWVDAPVNVIATTQDNHVPLERQLEMADAAPTAFVRHVDADHYACVARADLFVPTLFEACREVSMATPVRAVRSG